MSHLDVVKIKTGSPYETKAGYSRAVAVGDVVMVSLTAGIDYATRIMPPDARGQATQCLSTIAAALAAAGSGLLDVVRVRAIVPTPRTGTRSSRCWGTPSAGSTPP